MRKLLRLSGIFITTVIFTHVIASALVTQHVLARVADMGLTVPMSMRITSTIHDIGGMLPSYMPLIAVGLLIAFLVAALLARFAPAMRTFLFALAGAMAVITVNVALKAAFDITPVAAARTLGGLLAQGAAGAVGGLMFAMLARPARV